MFKHHRFGFRPFHIFAVALIGLLGVSACRHKDRSERILKHIDSRVSKLDLNETQKAKYQEIRSKVAVELKSQFAVRQKVRDSLKTELTKPEPDMRGASVQLEKLMKDRGDGFARLPGYFADFYETLNPEQKAKVLKKMRDRLDL